MKKKVLDVGQCDLDHRFLKRLVASFGVDIVRAHTIEDAFTMLKKEKFTLVLVNRIIDRDGSHGMLLIERMAAGPSLREIPVMLISNFEEYQNEAVEKGAVYGFGKNDLDSDLTREKLSKYL